MFSRRWRFPGKNRLTLLLEEKKRSGVPVIDLTASNPTAAGFAYPGEEILAAVGQPEVLRYAPHPLGSGPAREAVAAYYADRGVAVAPSDVVITCSSSESYAYLFKLLCDPGDTVLAPRPSYPLFDFLARSEGARLTYYPLLREENWRPDWGRLKRLAKGGPKAALLVQPNNPTGSLLSPAGMAELLALCRLRRMALICDEVFFDYRLTKTEAGDPLLEGEALSFTLNGLSKISALPQMKLGWIVLRGPRRQKDAALRRLELIADTYLSVSATVQAGAERLLKVRKELQPQILQRLKRNWKRLKQSLEGSPLEALPVEAGWYAVVRLPRVRSEEEWVLGLLQRRDTLAHPGHFYGFQEEAFLVVSLLCAESQFAAGLENLLAEADA